MFCYCHLVITAGGVTSLVNRICPNIEVRAANSGVIMSNERKATVYRIKPKSVNDVIYNDST
jgi:hypothetical protein